MIAAGFTPVLFFRASGRLSHDNNRSSRSAIIIRSRRGHPPSRLLLLLSSGLSSHWETRATILHAVWSPERVSDVKNPEATSQRHLRFTRLLIAPILKKKSVFQNADQCQPWLRIKSAKLPKGRTLPKDAQSQGLAHHNHRFNPWAGLVLQRAPT